MPRPKKQNRKDNRYQIIRVIGHLPDGTAIKKSFYGKNKDEALLKYHDENNIIFSMPGNKCGLAFKRDEFGIELEKRLGSLDITEVDPLDNLHHPEGVIKESQELLAKTYGVKKAFFMVNGSSGGNLAAIFSAFNEGDEVLVERNCHKSIYNGFTGTEEDN